MGILMGIVSFVLGFAINLVDSAVTSMLNSVGYDMSTFLAVFPFAENAMDVFVALGLAFLTGGLIWNGIKGVAAPFGVEYENPLHITMVITMASRSARCMRTCRRSATTARATR